MLRSAADPFLVPTGASSRIQLSPTAESFTPVSMTGRAPTGSPTHSLSHGRSGIGYLNVNSHSDTHGHGNGFPKFPEQSASDLGRAGKGQIIRKNLPSMANAEHFDTERRSRAFVIENVPTSLSYMSLAGFFNVSYLRLFDR